MTQIIYSTTKVANAGGRKVKNPRRFLGPVEGATKVFIDGDWPRVRQAYEKANVPVASLSELPAGRKKAEPDPAPAAPNS